jgi:hypothetical protein
MNKMQLRYVLFPVLLVFAGVGVMGAYILAGGISARDEPGAAEAFIARRLRHYAIAVLTQC